MLLIELKPNQNGTHNDHSAPVWATVPEGWGKVPQELEGLARDLLPFVILTTEDGVITSISDDPEAREAWKAAQSEPEPEPMTTEELILDKLTELEYRQDLIALGLEGGIV